MNRSFALLPALVLASAVLMSAAGPALASFESAVADYERGAYQEAQTGFEAAAEAGDERAEPYLEKIRQMPSGENTWEMPATLVTDAGPAGSELADLFSGVMDSAPETPSQSYVVAPQHQSIWSTIFHLPGDATVIGLQHVAQSFDANGFSQELSRVSRSSDKIALGVLAGFWWIVIIKGVIGMAIGIGRLMKAAATRTETRRYG